MRCPPKTSRSSPHSWIVPNVRPPASGAPGAGRTRRSSRDLWNGVTAGSPCAWHGDRPFAARAVDDHLRYGSYVCAIHYLTDVGEEQPCLFRPRGALRSKASGLDQRLSWDPRERIGFVVLDGDGLPGSIRLGSAVRHRRCFCGSRGGLLQPARSHSDGMSGSMDRDALRRVH